MDTEFAMPKFAERERNFLNGRLPSTVEGKIYYIGLEYLANIITIAVNKMQETYSEKDILRTVFAYVYDFVMERNDAYLIFDETTLEGNSDGDESNKDSLSKITFEVCFFVSLCQFLYETIRIKRSSLREFVRKYSPENLDQKNPTGYHNKEGDLTSDDPLILKESSFRKKRHRILTKRPVYQESREWSAMPKVSEYEWALYFEGERAYPIDTRMSEEEKEREKKKQEKHLRIWDTEKRVRNLYNDIEVALDSKMDKGYIEKIDAAAKKFCSKLEKLKYERFIELEKYFLDYICRDTDSYGINLYRLEKEMKPYRITNDVNRLSCCNDEMQKAHIIRDAVLMDDIVFPRLYEYFSNLPSDAYIQIYKNTFLSFMDEVVQSSRLVIDKFVEDGIFGENWEQLFRKITNELAEDVLYDPSKIDYSLKPESQREFQIYLLAPVDYTIKCHKTIFSNLPSKSDGIDDEI